MRNLQGDHFSSLVDLCWLGGAFTIISDKYRLLNGVVPVTNQIHPHAPDGRHNRMVARLQRAELVSLLSAVKSVTDPHS
jgi:hypothetical protein